MKYAGLIQLGAADGPLEDLGDRSPLEAAHIPSIRGLAAVGRVAAVSALQAGEGLDDAASLARAVLSLMGYDLRSAEAIGASLSGSAVRAGVLGLDRGDPVPWCLRASLIGTRAALGGGAMATDSVIGPELELTHAEADAAWTAVVQGWERDCPGTMLDLQLVGEGASRVLIDRSPSGMLGVEAPSPQAGERVWTRLPGAGLPGAAARLHQLLASSAESLAGAFGGEGADGLDVSTGLMRPSMAWFDDLGCRPVLRPFGERFGLSAWCVTDDPGSAAVAGWAGLQCRVMETEELGAGAVEALAGSDAVLVIDTSAARAALAGDARSRQSAIDAFDRTCVGPVARRLRDFGDPERDPEARGWRLMVTPGVRADAAERTLVPDVVPVLLAGAWIRAMVTREFTEEAAESTDLRVERAHELMEYFLLGGLARARGVARRDLGQGSLWETSG